LRQFGRIGSALTALDFVHFGSSLSLRSYARMGSAISAMGISRFGNSMSVLDYLHLGSTLSCRNVAYVGTQLSVSGTTKFASLSLVADSKVGGSLTLRSFAKLGSSVSVLDFIAMGSSLSVRSFSYLGSALAVFGGIVADGAMAINADTPFYMGGYGGTTYMRYESTGNNVEFYNQGNRRLKLSSTGGHLHGVWSGDVSLTLSDRRVKTAVEPLEETLRQTFREQTADGADTETSPASWLLRELRPVSFRLKTGPEAKYTKFGFIAQDLERLFPDMVRTDAESGVRQVVYQDLLALLTTLAQTQEARQKSLEEQVSAQQRLITALQDAVFDLQRRMASVEEHQRRAV
jgi:hypothetical protein